MLWRVLVLMGVLGSALSSPAVADSAPAPWRINSIPLDMPLDEELNGEYLEGIYQEKLKDRLIDSVLSEWPSYHIRSTLTGTGGAVGSDTRADDRSHERMELYFSSAADQRRLFWIRVNRVVTTQPGADGIAQALTLIQQGFAKADRLLTAGSGSGSTILIMVDTSLPPDEQQRLRAALPDPATLNAADFDNFWAMDLKERARLLGTAFRGGIAILNVYQGQLQSVQLELLDLQRAQTVFNLATP